MKVHKDMIGNTLAEGNQVFVKMGQDWVFGWVDKIDPGGVAIPGQKELTPGRVIIGIKPVIYAFKSTDTQPQMLPILKLVDPAVEKAVDAVMGGTPAPGPKLVT